MLQDSHDCFLLYSVRILEAVKRGFITRATPGVRRTLEDKPRELPSCKHGIKPRWGEGTITLDTEVQ